MYGAQRLVLHLRTQASALQCQYSHLQEQSVAFHTINATQSECYEYRRYEYPSCHFAPCTIATRATPHPKNAAAGDTTSRQRRYRVRLHKIVSIQRHGKWPAEEGGGQSHGFNDHTILLWVPGVHYLRGTIVNGTRHVE